MQQNPNNLKGSKIKITNSADEYEITIPGYKVLFNLGGFIWVGSAVFLLTMLLKSASETRVVLVSSALLFIIMLSVIIMHSKTKIYFSKKNIKIRYGWFPFVRTRKTKNLNKVHIEFSESSSEGGSSFTYLVLSFSKEWKISIIIDHLSRSERDFLTGRLSYLRYKFQIEKK